MTAAQVQAETARDGGFPLAGVLLDSAGNLYGTGVCGGSSAQYVNTYNAGCGAVYELDTDGQETMLYSFTGEPMGATRPQLSFANRPATSMGPPIWVAWWSAGGADGGSTSGGVMESVRETSYS